MSAETLITQYSINLFNAATFLIIKAANIEQMDRNNVSLRTFATITMPYYYETLSQ